MKLIFVFLAGATGSSMRLQIALVGWLLSRDAEGKLLTQAFPSWRVADDYQVDLDLRWMSDFPGCFELLGENAGNPFLLCLALGERTARGRIP